MCVTAMSFNSRHMELVRSHQAFYFCRWQRIYILPWVHINHDGGDERHKFPSKIKDVMTRDVASGDALWSVHRLIVYTAWSWKIWAFQRISRDAVPRHPISVDIQLCHRRSYARRTFRNMGEKIIVELYCWLVWEVGCFIVQVNRWRDDQKCDKCVEVMWYLRCRRWY